LTVLIGSQVAVYRYAICIVEQFVHWSHDIAKQIADNYKKILLKDIAYWYQIVVGYLGSNS